jgi:5-oxoprolinase (ATP-hydrolysing)
MVDIFRRNSRIPEWLDSDLTALVAACKTAAVRVCELCDRYGYEVYQAATEDLLERNRRAIANVIDNKVGSERAEFTDFIDDDGHGNGPLGITCAMYKEGHKLIFDWDGTCPQVNSAVNFYLSPTMFRMFVGYFLLAVYDPHAVVNDGKPLQ